MRHCFCFGLSASVGRGGVAQGIANRPLNPELAKNERFFAAQFHVVNPTQLLGPPVWVFKSLPISLEENKRGKEDRLYYQILGF